MSTALSTWTRTGALTRITKNSPIMAVLATPGVKQDGVDLVMTGCRLTRYRTNPVLLMSHDIVQMPIGRVANISITPERITGQLIFSTSDPLAQMVETKVREGVINAVSVRYNPNKFEGRSRCTDWDLVETSIVSVPMDENSVIYTRALKDHIRRSRRIDSRAAQRLLDAFTLRETPEERVKRIVRQVLVEKLSAK